MNFSPTNGLVDLVLKHSIRNLHHHGCKEFRSYHGVGMESIDMGKLPRLFLKNSHCNQNEMLETLTLGRSFSGAKIGDVMKKMCFNESQESSSVLGIWPPISSTRKTCRVGRFYEENLLLEMFEHWRRAALDSYGDPPMLDRKIHRKWRIFHGHVHLLKIGWIACLKLFHCVVKVSQMLLVLDVVLYHLWTSPKLRSFFESILSDSYGIILQWECLTNTGGSPKSYTEVPPSPQKKGTRLVDINET